MPATMRMLLRSGAAAAGGLLLGGIGKNVVWAEDTPKTKDVELVLLGTGSSIGVPQMRCLLSKIPCKVCLGAAAGDMNTRGNPSLLLRVPPASHLPTAETTVTLNGNGGNGNNASEEEYHTVLIDCGKTFRESSVRFFKGLGVQFIDSVLLTHYHSDAVLGLDDIRDFQRILVPADSQRHIPAKMLPISVFCDESTARHLKGVFPYLMQPPPAPGAPKQLQRYVSQLTWNVFKKMEPLNIHGLNITPLPFEHGSDCTAYGFDIQSSECRVVYISDVSKIPEATHQFLKSRPIDLFIIDSLFKVREHNTHFNMAQALSAIRLYSPKKAFLTGMAHDFDYYRTNDELQSLKKEDNIDVSMGYDGLKLTLPLLDIPQPPHQ